MQSQYFNVEQAAEYLNTSERFVRRLVLERRVVFYKVGAHIRFAQADLDAFVQAGRVDVVERRGSGMFVARPMC